jgi:hypothetical protein
MVNHEGNYIVINHTLVKYRGREKDITIPENITVIGAGAFDACSFITNVNIPMGVKKIDYSAFNGCSGLTEIVLPDSVISLGFFAFENCTNLANITVPADVIFNGNPFINTKWMLDYPGDFIILNGKLLTYRGTDELVVIPDNVTTISDRAFTGNNVSEVIIPKNVVKISYMAFNNCRNLEKVFITSRNTYIEFAAFYNCSNDLKLYSAAGGTAEEFAQSNNIQFINYGLNKEKATIYISGNDFVSLRVNGVSGDVLWESENETIAKVCESGIVTAVNTGTTQIKAIIDDITMTCQITVKKPYISKKTVSTMAGYTSRLNIIGISKGLNWSSSNKKVATVSSNGVITAIKAGTALITAKYNGKTYTCTVTVK